MGDWAGYKWGREVEAEEWREVLFNRLEVVETQVATLLRRMDRHEQSEG